MFSKRLQRDPRSDPEAPGSDPTMNPKNDPGSGDAHGCDAQDAAHGCGVSDVPHGHDASDATQG